MADPMVVVVAGVADKDGKIMLCRRNAHSLEGMKWEFPGGKVERGETPEDALVRELREELGVETRTGALIDAIVHPASPYPDKGILLLYYRTEIVSGDPQAIDCSGIAWTEPDALDAFALAPADALFISRMADRWTAFFGA